MSKKIAYMDDCTGRACIIEYRHEGEWKPAQFKDEARQYPAVHKCNCSAGKSIIDMALSLAKAALKGDIEVSDLPQADDFRIIYVDEEALPPEVEVAGTEQASDIINSIRSKA